MGTGILFTVLTRLLHGRAGVCGLALVVCAALPATLPAETLSFRNDTNSPVMIQGSYVVRGQVRRDQPILLQPNGVAKITLPGNKLITVYDARLPNRVLFQDTINASTEDQAYSVLPDKVPGKVKVEEAKPAMMAKPR
jgi:hypothetical protein